VPAFGRIEVLGRRCASDQSLLNFQRKIRAEGAAENHIRREAAARHSSEAAAENS